MKIITVSNNKGGVGKTTSCINIGAGLSLLNKKVLLIDLDPQANLSQSLGIFNSEKNMYGVLKDEYEIEPIHIIENLDIVPSSLELAGAETELINEAGREYILKEKIEPIKNNYDYIIIDSPPSLGLLTINSFTCSEIVLVPIQAEFLAVQGSSILTDVIKKIQKRINQNLSIGGVFMTQYDDRKIINRNAETTINNLKNLKPFSTKIRNNIALAESQASGIDIFRYDSTCNGALDYKALSLEILERFNNEE